MIRTLLVALDCSEISEQVIQGLNHLQLHPQAKIILSHVLFSPESDGNIMADQPHQSPESLYLIAENLLRDYQLQLPGSEIEIVNGDPAEEIIRLANIYQAEMIVIGTRGLQGVKRVIEGSVSSQVVADAPCSVLVIKS